MILGKEFDPFRKNTVTFEGSMEIDFAKKTLVSFGKYFYFGKTFCEGQKSFCFDFDEQKKNENIQKFEYYSHEGMPRFGLKKYNYNSKGGVKTQKNFGKINMNHYNLYLSANFIFDGNVTFF
jgi:hypothetical protein